MPPAVNGEVEEEAEGESTGENGKRRRRTRIQWAEDVIDNEGLGRKKSKGLFTSPHNPYLLRVFYLLDILTAH